jgi:hypothetical protein
MTIVTDAMTDSVRARFRTVVKQSSWNADKEDKYKESRHLSIK